MSLKRERPIAVNERGKARRQSAAGAWAVKKKDAGARRESELGMRSVAAGIGMEADGSDSYGKPDKEKQKLAKKLLPFVGRFIKSHREPHSELRIPAERGYRLNAQLRRLGLLDQPKLRFLPGQIR